MVKAVKFSNLPFPVCIALLSFLLSCAGAQKMPAPLPGHPKPYKVSKRWYQPLKDAQGFRERGMASWYGRGFHGRKTASGETYDMYALTAAHRTLPLGTYVRVHNLNNGKAVDVRINDRGPFVHRRIIDLSFKAAKRIGLVVPGTAPVEIVSLRSAKGGEEGGEVQQSRVSRDYSVGDFTVQVGAFMEEANAVRLRNKLASTHEDARIAVHKGPHGGTLYRVQVGKCQSLEKAKAYEKALEGAGYTDAMVVAR